MIILSPRFTDQRSRLTRSTSLNSVVRIAICLTMLRTTSTGSSTTTLLCWQQMAWLTMSSTVRSSTNASTLIWHALAIYQNLKMQLFAFPPWLKHFLIHRSMSHLTLSVQWSMVKSEKITLAEKRMTSLLLSLKSSSTTDLLLIFNAADS